MMVKQETTRITIRVAARRTGLSPHTVRRYVRRGLVGDALTEADLAELRRIRRLTDLGINLAGVEAILRMRDRVAALQKQVEMLGARSPSFPGLPEVPKTWALIPLDKWDEAD
jgi:MerR family transcriptional regulator, heat shock protein HspR